MAWTLSLGNCDNCETPDSVNDQYKFLYLYMSLSTRLRVRVYFSSSKLFYSSKVIDHIKVALIMMINLTYCTLNFQYETTDWTFVWEPNIRLHI